MLRKFLYGSLIFIILLVGAALAIPYLFKDKIVSSIRDEINKNINAVVSFNNNIDITFISTFPRLGVSVQDLILANKNEFAGDTLIQCKKITLQSNLGFLWNNRSPEISKILIMEPDIYAHVLKNGVANWDITIQDTVQVTEKKDTSKFTLSLQNLQIENGKIIYNDESLGLNTRLEGLNYSMTGDFTEDNFILTMNSEVKKLTTKYGGISYLKEVKTNITADIDMDLKNYTFTLKNNQIKLNELQFSLNGYIAMPADNNIDMDLKLLCHQAEFKNILSLIPGVYTKSFSGIKTSGTMSLSAQCKGIYNDTKIPSVQAGLMVKNGAFSYPSMPLKAEQINFNLQISNPDGNPDHTIINLPEFHALLANNPFDFSLYLKTPVSDPDFNTRLKTHLVLDDLKQLIPLENNIELSGIIDANLDAKGKLSAIESKSFEDFNAAGNLNLKNIYYHTSGFSSPLLIHNASLQMNPAVVNLSDLYMHFGKSDLRAKGDLTGLFPYIFSHKTLSGKLNIQSAYLNVNPFLSNDTLQQSQPAPADTIQLSPPSIPSNIDFTFTSDVKEFIYDNVTLKNAVFEARMKEGNIYINRFKSGVFNGQISMNGIYYSGMNNQPSTEMNIQLENIDIQQLSAYSGSFNKMLKSGQYMEGNITTTLSTKTGFDRNMHPVLEQMNARGTLMTPRLKIKGHPALSEFAEKMGRSDYKQVIIEKIKTIVKIENGRMYFEPWSFRFAGNEATAAGSHGLDQSLDYYMDIYIPKTQLGALNGELQKLLTPVNTKITQITIPEKLPVRVLLNGNFKKPLIKLDFTETKNKLLSPGIKSQIIDQANQKKDEMIQRGKEEAERQKQQAERKAREEADRAKQKAQEEADRIKKEAEKKAQEEAEKLKKQGKEKLKKGMENLWKK